MKAFLATLLLIVIASAETALAQSTPTHFEIRGTGNNNSTSRYLKLGTQVIYNQTGGRGLRLTVLNKSDLTVALDQTYDTYGSSTAAESLATALNNVNSGQIGVLTSFDAWEYNVTANLDNAFLRLGLSKASATQNSSRRPYAAIFQGASGTNVISNAIEVSYLNNSDLPYAEIRGYFIEGAFVASGSQQNALFRPQGNGTELIVNYDGNIGIGKTIPNEKLDISGAIRINNGSNSWRFVTNSDGSFSIKESGFSGTINIYKNGNINQNLLNLHNGNVGIGTTLASNPNNYKLAVNGKIGAKEVVVETSSTTWADYVFEENYPLMPLPELEAFLKKYKHLPEIPTAEDVEEKGQSLGEMNILLLKKVEELTLYLIQLEKKNEQMEIRLQNLEKNKK